MGEAERDQVVGPIEAGDEGDGLGVIGADDCDQILVDLLPFVPRDGSELIAEGGGLVEQLIKGDGVVAGEVAGQRASEVVGLLERAEMERPRRGGLREDDRATTGHPH